MNMKTNNLQAVHHVNAHRAAFVADAARTRRAYDRRQAEQAAAVAALKGPRYVTKFVNGQTVLLDRVTFEHMALVSA